jgi:HSP20 family molecular chaperone IbpA
MFDMDQWMKAPFIGTSTLDLFDPYDELDNTISRNLHWLNKPDFLQTAILPKIPQKYRITVDCAGFKHESIKTQIKDNKLIVSGKEEEKTPGKEDYMIKDFKKTYDLPDNAQSDKLVSFMTSGGGLVIEVPLKETKKSPDSNLFPQIINEKDGNKSVAMDFNLPENINPSKVNVNIKDRDLILRVEDKVDQPDKISRFEFYQRTTLPENTKFDELKCVVDKNQIHVTAPLNLNLERTSRSIPIETKKQIK